MLIKFNYLQANHAKWEPWHGKFGLYYPWDKYLEIGEHLRELAATIISLKGCLQSPKQVLITCCISINSIRFKNELLNHEILIFANRPICVLLNNILGDALNNVV